MAFRPVSTTLALAVGTSASSVTLTTIPTGIVPTGLALLAFANGTEPVFINWTGTAVLPASGSPTSGVWVPAGQQVMILPPAGALTTVSAIAASTGTTLYLTQAIPA